MNCSLMFLLLKSIHNHILHGTYKCNIKTNKKIFMKNTKVAQKFN